MSDRWCSKRTCHPSNPSVKSVTALAGIIQFSPWEQQSRDFGTTPEFYVVIKRLPLKQHLMACAEHSLLCALQRARSLAAQTKEFLKTHLLTYISALLAVDWPAASKRCCCFKVEVITLLLAHFFFSFFLSPAPPPRLLHYFSRVLMKWVLRVSLSLACLVAMIVTSQWISFKERKTVWVKRHRAG